MSLQERLRDLHKQATTERSHFYVAKCVTEAIAELDRLQARVAELEVDAERWQWIRKNLAVARDEDGAWTCWLQLACIPFRSQTTDPTALLDSLMARFPLDTARKAKP